MADVGVERKGPRVTWAWLGLGILLLGALAWLIFSFWGFTQTPEPVPVEFDRTTPGAQPAPTGQAPGQTAPGQP